MHPSSTAVMVVGALIFVLGIDLVKEALWDTRHRVSWSVHMKHVKRDRTLMALQDGVYHHREHHDLHDCLGLRHWCHIRHCCKLYVRLHRAGISSPSTDIRDPRCVFRGAELAAEEHPNAAHG